MCARCACVRGVYAATWIIIIYYKLYVSFCLAQQHFTCARVHCYHSRASSYGLNLFLDTYFKCRIHYPRRYLILFWRFRLWSCFRNCFSVRSELVTSDNVYFRIKAKKLWKLWCTQQYYKFQFVRQNPNASCTWRWRGWWGWRRWWWLMKRNICHFALKIYFNFMLFHLPHMTGCSSYVAWNFDVNAQNTFTARIQIHFHLTVDVIVCDTCTYFCIHPMRDIIRAKHK